MVEYRRLATEADFDQVSELQRRVFGFSDLEVLPPPLLRTVARNQPPLGLHIGAFQTEGGRSELIGVILGFATFEPGTVYTVLLGVLPEKQDGPYGTKLLLQFREEGLRQGLKTMFGVFDVLDPRLARLYVGGLGFVGTSIQAESLLFRWDFLSPLVVGKLNRLVRPNPGDGFQNEVLLTLPKKDPVALEHFLQTATAYVNDRGYEIVDCVTVRQGEERVSKYVLRPRASSGLGT